MKKVTLVLLVIALLVHSVVLSMTVREVIKLRQEVSSLRYDVDTLDKFAGVSTELVMRHSRKIVALEQGK